MKLGLALIKLLDDKRFESVEIIPIRDNLEDLYMDDEITIEEDGMETVYIESKKTRELLCKVLRDQKRFYK